MEIPKPKKPIAHISPQGITLIISAIASNPRITEVTLQQIIKIAANIRIEKSPPKITQLRIKLFIEDLVRIGKIGFVYPRSDLLFGFFVGINGVTFRNFPCDLVS
jgi:hypothetical protein